MTPEPLEIGDVVLLKSGGPFMTVTYIDSGGAKTNIHVQWFDDEKVLHTAVIAEAALDRKPT